MVRQRSAKSLYGGSIPPQASFHNCNQNGMSNLVNRVDQYYIDTAWDYKHLWIGKALAVHFGYYDDRAISHNTALLNMNEVLAKKANIQNNEKVIDAGCGIGGSSIWLAKTKNCEVVGLNIVDWQIKEAFLNASHAGVSDKVHFIKADYAHVPLCDHTFNVFWALESLVHAQRKEDVIREAHRLLNDDGRIVIAEYMLRENPTLNHEEYKFLNPWLKGWSMPDLLTSSNYEEYLRSAGFTNIQKFDIGRNVCHSLQRLKWLCRLALPGAMMMESLGLFTKGRVANIKGSLRQISTFKKGYWSYYIIVATKAATYI